MAAPSFPPMPWQLLDGAQQLAQRLRPPTWLEHELHNRAVLLVNHVLMQASTLVQTFYSLFAKCLNL